MYTSFRPVHAGLALAVVVIVGCGLLASGPRPMGSLAITIIPADGTRPSVVVAGGPSAISRAVNATTTLTLPAGTYTIVTDSALGPDSVVGTITDTGHVVGSPAVLTDGVTTPAVVTYSTKGRVGGLWVANNAYRTIPEVASSQLRLNGTVPPAETLATAAIAASGLAIDQSGDMWESSESSDSLIMYSPAARNAGGGTPPTRVIVSSALSGAEDITFDTRGNLWVANSGDCNGGSGAGILEFTTAQLAAGGAQTPAIAVTASPVLACPFSIAFDASGNAWVADDNNPQIVEFSGFQLSSSGNKTPGMVISGGGLVAASAVAFESAGALWVANDGGASVVAYTPAQLLAGGVQTPFYTVTLPAGAVPWGLAFDNRGTLWVSDVVNAVMWGLSSSQLTATGSPTPAWGISVFWGDTLLSPQQPAFDPWAAAVAPSVSRLGSHPIAPVGAGRHVRRRRHHDD